MARVKSITTVTRDGMHNAFTDLIHWQGAYWIVYRKGSHHSSPDSWIAVASSFDRRRFVEVGHVRVPGDNRDAKLVPTDGGKRLAMVFPSRDRLRAAVGRDKPGKLRLYVAFSDDGHNWQTPTEIEPGRPNQWLWRVRQHDGVYYGLSYGPGDHGRWEDKQHWLALLRSDDLLQWQHLAWVNADGPLMNECDLTIRDDGRMWILGRSARDTGCCAFASAAPPYTDWSIKLIPPRIEAPVLLEHGGALYAAGRCWPHEAGNPMYHFGDEQTLGLFGVEFETVRPILHLPANGDCSYPGLIADPDGRVCMSYYSSHAYFDGTHDPPRTLDPDQPASKQIADIYFAELELP